MKDEKKQDKGLSLHSDLVNEVMGEIPHWIVQWGAMLMTVVMLVLFIGGYIIYVPEYIDVPYIVKGKATPLAVRSPASGILYYTAKDSTMCDSQQKIARVHSSEGDSIVATFKRGLFFSNILYQNNSYISKGDTIGWVEPTVSGVPSILVEIPSEYISKVKVNQTVLLSHNGTKEITSARIEAISHIVTGDIFLARIKVEDKLKEDLRLLRNQDGGNARILIERQRLIRKLSVFNKTFTPK